MGMYMHSAKAHIMSLICIILGVLYMVHYACMYNKYMHVYLMCAFAI